MNHNQLILTFWSWIPWRIRNAFPLPNRIINIINHDNRFKRRLPKREVNRHPLTKLIPCWLHVLQFRIPHTTRLIFKILGAKMSFEGEVGGAIDGDVAGQGFVAGPDVILGKAAGVDAVKIEGGGLGAFEGEHDLAAFCVVRVGDAVVGFRVGRDGAILRPLGTSVFDGYVVVVEVAVCRYYLSGRAVVELGSGD